MAALQVFQETVYVVAGKRTKRAVSKIRPEHLEWSATGKECFDFCKQTIASRAPLAHCDTTKRANICTDPSNTPWSEIVTQVRLVDPERQHSRQYHPPLAFLSGTFLITRLGWSLVKKKVPRHGSCGTCSLLGRCSWRIWSIYWPQKPVLYFQTLGNCAGLTKGNSVQSSTLDCKTFYLRLCL